MLRLIFLPSFIPIKESFIYLGITIYKDIHKIARDNFNNISLRLKMTFKDGRILKSLSKEESPLLRWICYLDLIFFSLCYHFLPSRLLKEINSIISKFIWNDKCPEIKLTTLQHPNSAGGLAVPNFELYYWSFQLKALHNWVDSQSTVSWRVIEADKVKPNRLPDIYLLAQEKKGIIINLVRLWLTLLKSGKRLNVG